MENNLTHKGYSVEVSYNYELEQFSGKVSGVNEPLNIRGRSMDELKRSFREAVDLYLKTVSRLEKEPSRPYKGLFNVRLSPELHQRAGMLALRKGISLNDLVRKALISVLENEAEFFKK